MNEKKYKRIFTIVIDSLGVGEMPDAASYGDAGTDTLGHIAENVEKLKIPNLQNLGMANLKNLSGMEPAEKPMAYYRKLREASNGKDTMTGHMIVYTSADSVLQICGNEETFGLDVISVGKIFDIFDGEGITESNKSKSSVHGMEQTIEIAKRDFEGFCFVNLVDFDALWGHRRDVKGYAQELEKFDVKLGELLSELKEDDLLIITADHGNDPTHIGTDHTREKVPFLAYSPSMKEAGELEEADTFAIIGATIADNFGVKMPEGTIGHSILYKLN